MADNKILIEKGFEKDSRNGSFRFRMPVQILEWLGAESSDQLIIESGSMESVTRAAISGRYVVIRLKRRPAATPPSPATHTAAPSVAAREDSAPVKLEPLGDVVRRKINGQD